MNDTVNVLETVFDVPVECSFRRHGTLNQLPTYPVPPLTTLRGAVYSALGRPSILNQESYHYRTIEKEEFETEYSFRKSFEEKTQIGIIAEDLGIVDTDLRTRQKKSRSDNDEQAFITYVAEEETIISPTYRVFFTGPEDLLESIEKALESPERPLFLGRSDDIVDIRVEGIVNAQYIDRETTFDSDTSNDTDKVIVPNSPKESFLLPVEMETYDRSAKPAKLQLVGIGGDVDGYYETASGYKFVFID